VNGREEHGVVTGDPQRERVCCAQPFPPPDPVFPHGAPGQEVRYGNGGHERGVPEVGHRIEKHGRAHVRDEFTDQRDHGQDDAKEEERGVSRLRRNRRQFGRRDRPQWRAVDHGCLRRAYSPENAADILSGDHRNVVRGQLLGDVTADVFGDF
jgi:hypothetical protein